MAGGTCSCSRTGISAPSCADALSAACRERPDDSRTVDIAHRGSERARGELRVPGLVPGASYFTARGGATFCMIGVPSRSGALARVVIVRLSGLDRRSMGRSRCRRRAIRWVSADGRRAKARQALSAVRSKPRVGLRLASRCCSRMPARWHPCSRSCPRRAAPVRARATEPSRTRGR
jgi:hypothetical protein